MNSPASPGQTPMNQPPAASQPSGPVQRWHDRIKAAHPNSDPAYWPLSLKAGYMEDEIIELRAALAATQPPAASQRATGEQK